VKVKYNTRATKELVKELNPDAVVVATGSVPVIPDVRALTDPM